jgi:hypothetical protein
MTIRGSFEIFSLPELFQIIDLGTKSGRLLVQVLALPKSKELKGPYYLWFDRGRLVAVTNRFNHRGLIELIEAQGWLSQLISKKLERLCPSQMPLGNYLDKMKLLKTQQLNLLFQLQLHQVYQLFALSSGWFRFDEISADNKTSQPQSIAMPYLEMTGKSMGAIEITLHALRVLDQWNHFQEQFPEPNSVLQQLMPQPNLQLSLLEWQIWKLANSQNSLKTMAGELHESLFQIQKAAFRLMVTGMVEEIPQSSNSFDHNFLASPPHFATAVSTENSLIQQQAPQKKSFSDSFLPNLVNFLRRFF